MSSGPQIHRVVTGHDDRGHAVILVDDIAPNAFSSSTIPGFGAAVPWLTRHPIDHTTDEDPVGEGSPTPTFPRVGETVFRIAEFPPDSAYPEAAQDAIFEEIDGKAEAQDGTKHSADKHFWFHRTDSLDYAIVLEGEITLLVDEGEPNMMSLYFTKQRPRDHTGNKRTQLIARVAFVLIGTEPLSADQIARQRRDLSVRAG